MPLTKSAKKALRQDRTRTKVNQRTKLKLKTALDAYKENPTKENLSKAYSAVDRTVKKNLIHKNKAARIKSSLSKKTTKSSSATSSKKTASKTSKTSKKASVSKK